MALPPQRQKLAAEIAELARLQRERYTLQAASNPARQAVMDARAALDHARAHLEQAARNAVDRKIVALAGHSDEPPPPVERARQAVREAEDTVAALHAAQAEIESRSRGVERAIRSARDDVAHEAKQVLWSEGQAQMRAMIGEVRSARQAYGEAAARAKFLYDLAPRSYREDTADAAELRRLMFELETPPLDWSSARGGPDAVQKWRDALTALQTDASAKLRDSSARVAL